MRLQKLTCDRGHEWTRKPANGRPPHLCPTHKAEALTEALEALQGPSEAHWRDEDEDLHPPRAGVR